MNGREWHAHRKPRPVTWWTIGRWAVEAVVVVAVAIVLIAWTSVQ